MLFIITQYAILLAAALLTCRGMFLAARPLLHRLKTRLGTDRRHRARMKHLLERKRQNAGARGSAAAWFAKAERELELMLRTTQGDKYAAGSVQSFLFMAFSLVATAFLLAFFASGSLRFSAFMAVFSVFCLWAGYRLKLRKIQIQGGYDLAEAVGILTSKYKVSRGNMRSALRAASQEVSSPLIRYHFIHMVREEMSYTSPAEMQRAVEEFVYAIDTSFAKQLGLTILKGLVRGEFVESTLSNIDKNIHKNIDVLRDEGDSSSEVLQLSWLHLILFPLLIVFMVMFMGLQSTLHYQFETESGRYWLAVTLLVIFASLLMAVWFKKPPNDY
ncbi:hypothetical protein [Paenibacillus hamazuiensis]|uniref:hypothetical protein n=1 Tax=Paenibacillus hamazuiensis TaxID=2936508 RepID=UPI00200C01D2|nr:hypothetical protein [Paenibacillus hamazuiensis]